MPSAPAESYVDKARRAIRGPADVVLLVRMTAWCVTFRVLKHVLPIESLVALARFGITVPDVRPQARMKDREARVVTLCRWVARFTRVSNRGPCLERSLIVHRYLAALGAHPTLVIGVATGESATNPLRGHAWVVVDGEAVDETPQSLAGFHAVVEFEADGHRVSA
ncbi:MAG: lasso peptide biosynthesis B2 protein [Acidobacteriaceae bacterium]|nr:lasso peptide biosynthesis B2 protein [Acidobacteriaceae bacterium]